MSILEQSLLIANVNYHVGHWVAIYVAEEQGFFKEEGLTRYEYERGGLLPGPSESQTLGLAIKEHGVDIATAVDTESAIYQKLQGADIYIVGGWRYTPFLKWYGSKHITDISKLRGGKIGVRETSADGGGLVEFFIEEALKEAGVNPETEVEQVQNPVFGYRRTRPTSKCSVPEKSMRSRPRRLFPINSRKRVIRSSWTPIKSFPGVRAK